MIIAWIVIGTLLSCGLSLGGFLFVRRNHKAPADMALEEQASEKQRAEEISKKVGLVFLMALQGAAGLAAGIPACALLFWGAEGFSGIPRIETFLAFAVSFVVGMPLFAWCLRVTEALQTRLK